MKKIPVLLLLVVLSISCQTLEISEKKPSCKEFDWFELGRSDGTQGLSSLNWQEREMTCLQFSESDHQSYVNGWYAGVDEFCSESHGFAFWKTGHKYFDVCPSSKEKVFLKAYRKGIKVFLFESDNKRIAKELEDLIQKASEATPQEKPSLVKKMSLLEEKQQSNRTLISNIESEMESTEDESTTL